MHNYTKIFLIILFFLIIAHGKHTNKCLAIFLLDDPAKKEFNKYHIRHKRELFFCRKLTLWTVS
jgi:hypothetical protein